MTGTIPDESKAVQLAAPASAVAGGFTGSSDGLLPTPPMPAQVHPSETGISNTLTVSSLLFLTGMLLSEKSLTRAKEAHTAGACPGFHSMKQLTVLLLPPGWDASPSQGYPQQYVAGTHLYPWVERDNVGQSILSKETTRWQGLGVEPLTFRSEVQRTSHYATVLPLFTIE